MPNRLVKTEAYFSWKSLTKYVEKVWQGFGAPRSVSLRDRYVIDFAQVLIFRIAMDLIDRNKVTNAGIQFSAFEWNTHDSVDKKLKNIISNFSSRSDFTFPTLKNAEILKICAEDKKISFGKSTIINHGNNSNYIILSEPKKELAKIKIEFFKNSSNNLVLIGKKIDFEGEILFKGSNNSAVFSGRNIKPVKLKIDFNNAQESLFFWGKGSTSSGAGNRAIIRGEKVQCLVGDDCMFSHNITLRTSDMHTIFDVNSNQRINNDGDVIIASHVWIGQDVLVLKRSSIGFGSIIGSKSLVTGNIPSFCIAGGTPAKVIRDGCSWDRMDYVTEHTLKYISSSFNDVKLRSCTKKN